MEQPILIMGAGHQGLAMAAHLVSNHVECCLWNRSRSHIQEILDTGKIVCRGILEKEVVMEKVSDDIQYVLQKVIMVTTPSTAHADIARILAEYVDDTYTVILNPGRTFGVLEFLKILQECGCKKLPVVAETQTIIYTCRRDTANGVSIYALKKNIPIATKCIKDVEKVIEVIPKCIRNNFVPASSLIETSLGNVGMILHCAPVLMNVGWIENTKVQFKYYYDGISKSVAGLLEKLDQERVYITKVLLGGKEVESLSQWLYRTYQAEGEDLYEQLQNNIYYRGIDAPKSLHHRYIEEDVPNGLVPLESVGEYLETETPVTSFIISFANIVMGVDYRKIGRRYQDYVNDEKGRRK